MDDFYHVTDMKNVDFQDFQPFTLMGFLIKYPNLCFTLL